jgi:ketosteroid isomerase-like protein
MSTATKPTNITDLDHELNQAIMKGELAKAFDKYYADSVVMQQNDDSPVAGKEVNRKREEEFMKMVEQFHGAKLLSHAVSGDITFSEWEYDMTVKGRGRAKMCEVAVRHWKNGQVARERFYYKGM